MDGGDEAQDGCLVGEEVGNTAAAFDFPVEALGHVGGAQPSAVGFWECEDTQAFGEIGLHPIGELG